MNSAATTIGQTGFLSYSRAIGLCTMLGRGFMFPSDTAIGEGGRIYTVSRGLPADHRTRRVTMCDLDSKFYGTFGAHGAGEGQFIWPSAIAADSEGQVYISDEYTHRINIYGSEGESKGNWGVRGQQEGQLNGPSGMAFDSYDNLYVSDHHNHRIQKFTRDGRLLLCFGAEELNLPWGITVDSLNDVYVANWGNDRIEKFSANGEFLRSYGASGREDGQFNRPSGVAVDGEGYIYVADWGNERVQVLDPDGGFVVKLRGAATLSKWAEEFLTANVEEAEARALANLEPALEQFGGDPHEESAHTEKFFWGPVSVKLDGDGRLYVTDSNRHRIQIYERT